ncbi:MAG: 30S ribosomal protein S1 [Nitrospiraceae bacterium]|nr:30S ribosomal protein S1 [Nitrospiraceae bacterium]
MNMQMEENRDLEQMYAETLQRVQRGSLARGRVIAVNAEGVVVDIGYKSEGIIPIAEFTKEDLNGLVEGSEIEVYVERINDQEGIITLSRDRASRIRAWDVLGELYQQNARIEGKIVDKTKGGLIVSLKGLKAFLPASQVDIKATKNLDALIGELVTVKILKFSPPRNPSGSMSGNALGATLIVSRRAILEEDRNSAREETLKILKEGAILKGTVKNITDYGVFVDLGGIDGLLHISDISWGRVNHPSEFFRIGDEKEFLVLKHDESSHKVTLGYKQKKADPWQTVDEKYAPGMQVKGKVVNITDYGVFVEVEDGLEGLVHISELDWAPRPKHPSKYLQVGEEIEAKVISVNKAERRLSLSTRQLRQKPWETVGNTYQVGQKISGKVKTITDFGAFVRLPEGVDGLIHISDLSWTRHIKHPSDMLKKGQKVDAVILSLEPEKERMALGIKQLTEDPWKTEIPARFRLGDECGGKVLRITDFGVFVELDGGVEGLVYSSEVDADKGVQEGDEIRVRIIKVNVDERKIGLSMKNVHSHEAQ